MLVSILRNCLKKPYKCDSVSLRWLRLLSGHTQPFPVISMDHMTPLPSTEVSHNQHLYKQLEEKRHKVWAGDVGVAETPRAGRKLTVGERIELLKDPDSEQLEIGTLAGLNLPYGDVFNAVNVVRVTKVCGQWCIISANDWTFKGGTSYPISVKKQLRAQEIAAQNNLPCIYLVDSGGAFLPLQADIYPDRNHGGRVFRNQAVLSSLGIPQIAVVTGSCTAGGAYIPCMSDEAIIVQGHGSLYIGGPPLVQAATGDVLTSEELGGAHVHCAISGCTDHFARSEEEAFEITRRVVASLNRNQSHDHSLMSCDPPEPPLYGDSDEEFSHLLHNDSEQWALKPILARLLDGSRLHQFKERFGPTLCTGFARVCGHLVGVVANDGLLTDAAALKGAHFIRLCNLRGIPLLFLVNTPSDSEFLSLTGNDGLTVKARSQMMSCLATSTVPKMTIVLGGCYGPSSYAMGGGCMQAQFVFSWPHSKIAVASVDHLTATLDTKDGNHGNRDELKQKLQVEEMEYPNSYLINDGVILPSETRAMISLCLDICSRAKTTKTAADKALNVLRM